VDKALFSKMMKGAGGAAKDSEPTALPAGDVAPDGDPDC
jgi:hypothetical protein